MKNKILFNPSKKDIVDYRIEEAELDKDGEVVYEEDVPKWSGKTWEWTIKAGEKVEFPCYVADALKNIYGFLEEIKPEEVKPETVVEAEPVIGGDLNCKFCGKTFTSKRNLGLHLGATHYDKL